MIGRLLAAIFRAARERCAWCSTLQPASAITYAANDERGWYADGRAVCRDAEACRARDAARDHRRVQAA